MSEAKKKELAAIKQDLLARKLEVEQELSQLYQEKFSDDQVQDVGDQALASTMESLKSSFQNTKHEEYKRILRALEMIEEGSYGICSDCSTPISQKRLQSFPNATRCIACQEAYEEGKTIE